MTLPASGTIKFSEVNTELGRASTLGINMAWIKSLEKVPTNPLSGKYSKAYYQSNMDGNCNNGNCVESFGSGNINCVNCVINGQVNCVNCDTQSYLQTNCNCACTYNCTFTTRSYNCNCACLCACAWSDDMLKDVEGDIKDPLAIVRELKGFYYRGNDMARELGLDPSLDVGVSAQNVEQVMPEALGPMMGDFKTVRYERLVPVLIEAIKELEKKINEK